MALSIDVTSTYRLECMKNVGYAPLAGAVGALGGLVYAVARDIFGLPGEGLLGPSLYGAVALTIYDITRTMGNFVLGSPPTDTSKIVMQLVSLVTGCVSGLGATFVIGAPLDPTSVTILSTVIATRILQT